MCVSVTERERERERLLSFFSLFLQNTCYHEGGGGGGENTVCVHLFTPLKIKEHNMLFKYLK